MITIKFNGKPTQIPTSTPITTFLTTHIHLKYKNRNLHII